MLSKVEARKKNGGDSGTGKLLNEIEAISKALYLDKNPSRTSFSAFNARSKPAGKTHLPKSKSKLKNNNEDPSRKDKKSIWNWKPLKALSNVRNRRLACCFSRQVHSIESLPVSFNDLSLSVHWKRRDGSLMTCPSKVFDGTAEFEEKLTHTCSVYGSRSGPHHSAKYEAKHFLLYASVFGTPDLDLGKHRVDLTRLLPLTLEELKEEKMRRRELEEGLHTEFQAFGKSGRRRHISRRKPIKKNYPGLIPKKIKTQEYPSFHHFPSYLKNPRLKVVL